VLATVLLVKGLTYPLALVAMSVLGTWDPLTPVYVFFWVLSTVALGLLLFNMLQTAQQEVAANTAAPRGKARAVAP
jgi:putative effector of murein hydrolase